MAKKKDTFKDMDKEALKKKVASLGEEIRAIRFQAEGSASKNVKESLAIKKQIARAMTEINSKQS